MPTTLLINARPYETRVALMEGRQCVEAYVERHRQGSVVGNVYLGRVVRVLPGMQAAFVDIGLEKAAFLYVGDVMGDLSSRRGKILGMEAQGRFQVVKALVPLAELHNYATTLRSITQGRATYKRSLSHYDPVPKELEAKIIEEAQKEREK